MVKIDLVRRPSLISPKHLLRYVFFTEMQVNQAAKILNTILDTDGIIPEAEWKRFVLSSRGLYVKVMRKLRDSGLVEKQKGEFRVSKDFAKALDKMSKYWSDIIESYESGDRSIRF